MKNSTSDFTCDDLNQFIETIDEVYELAKYKVLVENREADKEILVNCLEARKEIEQYKQILLLNA